MKSIKAVLMVVVVVLSLSLASCIVGYTDGGIYYSDGYIDSYGGYGYGSGYGYYGDHRYNYGYNGYGYNHNYDDYVGRGYYDIYYGYIPFFGSLYSNHDYYDGYFFPHY